MRRALLITVCLLLGPATAHAGVWQRATNSPQSKNARASKAVEPLLEKAYVASKLGRNAERLLILREARSVLEKAGAATSNDVDLRRQLADVHYGLHQLQGDRADLVKAAELLKWVSAHPLPKLIRVEVMSDLALCYARLGEHAKEVVAYDDAIAVAGPPEQLAVLLGNQAEGYMALGALRRAISGYRESLRVTPGIGMPKLGVTTQWGLAVALDRSGDLRGAMIQIREARAYDPNDLRINSDDWIYVPAHDEHWYRALGQWQHARAATDDATRMVHYRLAIAEYARYVDSAPEGDQWASLAEHRHRQCEREMRQVR